MTIQEFTLSLPTQHKLRRVIERDGVNCCWCGQVMVPGRGPKKPTIEHIVRKSDGGSNGMSNLKAAHSQCNQARERGFKKRKQTSPLDWKRPAEDALCRYCNQTIAFGELAFVVSYWKNVTHPCHAKCKSEGAAREAIECQTIDADCNDCKHFKRDFSVTRNLSCMKNGKQSTQLVHMGIIEGQCLKFNKPTQAFPNKWTGRECFEHRRA